MLITDDEAKELKTWIIKRLEDISDADSDVLADYVLALIRAEGSEPELKKNATENLEDFLKEHSSPFVNETFQALRTKSYLPGYVEVIAPGSSNQPIAPPSSSHARVPGRGGYLPSPQQGRKRTFHDRQEDGSGYDPQNLRDERHTKHLRRGGFDSRGRGYAGPNAHRMQQIPGALPPFGLPPGMTASPSGMPFDPNDPVAAMMTMQAMGFPPGIPQLPPQAQRFGGKTKINARCRDYDTKGLCTRGYTCPFDHGNNQVIVPGSDEYDPKTPTISAFPASPHGLSPRMTADANRGSYRGRGRGTIERGALTSQRRNRAEFSMAGPNHDHNITTIVIEQIPEDFFLEDRVRGFFSTFGSIEEVTMQAYKRLALVKYADYHSAKQAYDSPKVVFDNRFVKVYWYKPESALKPSNGTSGTTSHLLAKAEEPAFDREAFARTAEAAQKKLEDRKAAIRANEAKKAELEKAKEQLALKQAEEKGRLEEKLRAKGLSLADIIPHIAAGTSPPTNDSITTDPKSSAQTEMLRASLRALEEEAKSLGLDPEPWAHETSELTAWTRGRGRGRGRGSYRASGALRGRGALRGGSRGGGAFNLDNRPRSVKVEGVVFDAAADESLRQHLLGIGDFTSLTTDASRASITITFKDRFTAEKLAYGTKDIPSLGRVDFSWLATPLPPASGLVTASAAASAEAATLSTGAAVGRDGDGDGDGDTMMMGGEEGRAERMLNGGRNGEVDVGGGGGEGGGAGAAVEEREGVDYDVAEEDERWVVT